MPEKDPFNYSLLTYAWVVVLSMWGGVVSYLRKVKDGVLHKFSIVELIGELFTAGFIGIITFWLCEWSDMSPLLSAALIAISGHMGSRAIFQVEGFLKSRFPQDERTS